MSTSSSSSDVAMSTAPPSVADLLRPVHERWFSLVHEHLAPLLDMHTGLWTRWPAARFLSDQFQDWFDHERQLVRSLARCLPASEARRLEQSAAGVAARAQELDELGRRKADGETAVVARHLFAGLELWRMEVESALGGIAAEELTDQDRRLLEHLQGLTERER